MNERLIIRLPGEVHQPVHWLVRGDEEIIASGTLASARELSTLTERAGGRAVDVLVAASELTLTEVELPKKNRNQALKALPFMLEEQLATEMESLHFTLGKLQGDKQPVVVADRQQVRQWLSWLLEAGLTVNSMAPDVLALPLEQGRSAMLQVGEQILLRDSEYRGMTVDHGWLAMILPTLVAGREQPVAIDDYGHQLALDDIEDIEWHARPLELPLQILSQAPAPAVNLLHGEFAQRKAADGRWHLWRNAAILAGICLSLVFTQRYLQVSQLEQQQAQLKASSEQIFRQLFPNKRRVVRLKSQIQNHLNELAGGGQNADLLAMLSALRPAFERVPALKPATLKYDARRQEIRIQADAENFQQFEQFKAAVDKQFTVQSGAMNNNDGKVNGSLTIKVAS